MAKRRAIKQTEGDTKEAAATGKWLESLFQNSKDPIAFADVNGNVQAANKAFEDLTGYSQSELIEQKTFMDITPKEYETLEARRVRRVLETGISAEYEKAYAHKSGHHVPTLLNVFRVQNEAGEPIGTGVIVKDLTELTRFESDPRSSAKFPSENPFPVMRIAGDGTVLFANPPAIQLLGDVGVGQAAPDYWKKLSADVLKSGKVKRDVEVERGDNALSFAAIPVPDGNYVNLYGLDITTQRKAEQEIRDREEQLRLLIAGVKDYAIFMLDAQGHIITWNEGAKRIKGYEAGEIIGQHFSRFYVPEEVKQHKPDQELKVAEDEGRYEEEGLRLRKDGSQFWADVVITALRDDEGVLKGFSKVTRDITARKTAEEELLHSHGLVQAVIEESTDPIFAKDVQGRYLLANSATAAALGTSQPEIIGRSDSELNPGELADQLIAIDQRVMKTEKLEAVEETIGDSTYLAKKWPLRDNEGNVIGIVGVARDITKDKQAEAQIKDLAKFPSENPFPVLRIAGNGTVLFANSAAQPLLDGGDVGQVAPSFWKKLSADVLKSGEVKKGVEIEREDRTLGFTAVPVPEGDYINLYGLDITERKQAEKMTEQSLADTEALRRLSARSAQTLELDEILETALNEISNIVGVQHGCIYVFDQAGNLVIRGQQHLASQFLEAKSTISPHEGCAGQAVATKEVYAPPRDKHDFTCEDSKRLLHLDCLAAIPIISKGKVLGVVELFAPVHRRLSDRERRIVMTMADQLGSAIENANLYSKERNIANTLQETLLTVPKNIEGISFGNLYRSATAETARAGGDFYDLFELKHDRLGIVIGDVSGKGLAAASLTSLVKNTIKAYAYQHASPAKVIALTNDVIVDASSASSFVTLFFGILDKESGVLLYCNAGHPPPIIRRQSSAISLLKPGAPIIGVFGDLECQDFEETLRGTDVLFLYTDGAIEARRDRELYGEKRLVSLIKDLRSTSATELPEKVFDKLFDFAQGTMADDTALLALSLENGAMTRETVLEVLAEGLIKTLDIAGVAVMLIDPQMEHVHGAMGRPAKDWPDIKKVAVSLDEPASLIDALKSKSPVVVDDAEKDPRAVTWLVRNYQCKSTVYLPLFTDQKVFGVAIAAESRRFRHFNEDEVEQAQLLAAEAAKQLSDLDPTS